MYLFHILELLKLFLVYLLLAFAGCSGMGKNLFYKLQVVEYRRQNLNTLVSFCIYNMHTMYLII